MPLRTRAPFNVSASEAQEKPIALATRLIRQKMNATCRASSMASSEAPVWRTAATSAGTTSSGPPDHLLDQRHGGRHPGADACLPAVQRCCGHGRSQANPGDLTIAAWIGPIGGTGHGGWLVLRRASE